MGYIASGFDNAKNVIKNKPVAFAGLMLLQFLVLLLFVGGSGYLQVQILEELQGVLEPLEGANVDINQLQEGAPFIENVAEMELHFKTLKQYLWYMVLFLVGMVLTVNWALWAYAGKLLKKKVDWKNYATSFLITAALFSALVPFFLKKALTESGIGTVGGEIYILLILGIILWFFFLVGMRTKNLKDIREMFGRKLGKSVSLFLIQILVIVGMAYLMFISSLTIVIILGILSLFVLTFLKLFWIAGMEEI